MNENIIKEAVKKSVEEFIRPTDDMTLIAAQILSKKIRNKAKEMGVNCVVAISNKGGNPVLVECSDNSYIASFDIALNKSYTAVALKMSTEKLSSLASTNGSLYGIQFTNQGKIVIFGGGEPLLNKNNEIVGGLGVSGGTLEQDTKLAKYGKEIFEKGANNGY